MRLSPLDSHWLEFTGLDSQAPCSQKNPTELTSFSHKDVNSYIQPTLHRQADQGPSNGPKAGDKLHHCHDSFSTSKHLSQS